MAVFDYVRSRINKRLVADGHPPLPKDYDFKLIPVEDEDQMRNNGIYIARNASEVMNIRPGGYLFGSSMAFYSDLPRLFETIRAGDLSPLDSPGIGNGIAAKLRGYGRFV